VMISQASVQYISGFCKITLLKGSAHIQGFSLTPGVTVSNLHVPCWCPAARLHAAGSKAHKKDGNSSVAIFSHLKRLLMYAPFADLAARTDGQSHIAINVLDTCDCVLLLEGMSPEEQSWMVAAEDQSAYQALNDGSLHKDPLLETATYTQTQTRVAVISECMQVLPAVGGCVCVGSGMIGDQYALMQRSIQASYLPPTWQATASTILSDMKTRHQVPRDNTSGEGGSASESRSSAVFSPRILMCGAKGVGKSTCARYTANKLLSKHKAVCVLDCDVGQPEYGVPGMISLTIVTQPNLSPPHLHLQQPDQAYFFGDISTKSSPARLMASVELLMRRYSLLQTQFSLGDLSAIGISAIDTSHLGDNFNIFDSLAEKETYSLPLIVNTDGNIRYMGSEILAGIVSITQPHYVLQLVTEKDRHLPALEHLDASTIHALEPGSSAANPVSALDLRTLRLVSYFLGQNSLLKQHVRNANSFRSRCIYGASGNSNSSSSAEEGGGIYIRSGALVDKQGVLAAVFAGMKPWIAPASAVALGRLADDVPAHLLPALMNASLIGICETENSQELLLCNHNSSGKNIDNDTESHLAASTIFQTRQELAGALGHVAVTPCHGLGVVRSINLQQKQFYLLSPVDPNTSSWYCAGPTDRPGMGASEGRTVSPVALVRGSMALPVSLLFASNFPCHPYLTSASAGDGAAQTRARNNVKRRTYQAP